jgi:methyl-accepting chemotaxis protein
MRGMADNTLVQAHAAASGSEEATANVGLVAAAAEEVAGAIAVIERQVSQSASLVRSARQGFEAVDSRMLHLQAASGEIRTAVNLIQTIAQKTNLLALNATIEAARAGTAGRGFSVVAQEVKALAAQTARAVETIEGQVDDIQAATGYMASAVGSIVALVADMDRAASTVAASTAQQAGALSNISHNGQLAARRTQDVLHSITRVKADASMTGEVAEQVQADASALEQRADRLRHEVVQFISGVQAA